MITLDQYLLTSGISHSIEWAEDIQVLADPDQPERDPFPHQYEGLNLTLAYNRVGIYDETGAGKTLPIQANLIVRVAQGHRCVALMPPVLLDQFYESIHASFVGIEKHVSIEILEGTPKQRQKLIDRYNETKWPDIIILTYNKFLGKKKTEIFEGTKVKISDGYYKTLKDSYYNVLLCDEAQVLRNSTSNIHKRVYKWIGGKDTDEAALVLSTGTVAHTHLHQVYGMIRLVTPTAYGSHHAFKTLHIQYDEHSEFEKIDDYSNYEILTMNLFAQARRVEKKDVREDMPEKLSKAVPVILYSAHRSLYRRLLKERILMLEDKFIDATQETSLRQLAMKLVSNPNSYSDKPIKNAMDEELFQLIDSIALDSTKLIIFIHFNETADRLMELLGNYNPALINGNVSGSTAKTKAKLKFLKDDTCRILIAHPKSAGAGLNLQKVCSNVVFYETPDSPGDVGQAMDRVHRLNSTETVNVYFLSPSGTSAAKKIRQVVKKDDKINRVVGDSKALLGELFDEAA